MWLLMLLPREALLLLQRSAAVAEPSIDRVRDAIVVVAAVSGWVWP